MIASSTRRALAKRALSTADWLDSLVKQFKSTMKEHDIAEHKSKDSSGNFFNDDEMPFPITRGDVRELIREIHWHIKEIRRFSK